MSDGRCETCKWWGVDGQFMGWRTCALTIVKRDEPVHPESKALGGAHDDWNAHLKTAPDFGCVQWEAKA